MRKISMLFFMAIFAIGLNAQHSFSTDPYAEEGLVFKHQVISSKDSMMITHSVTQNITSANSVSCSASGLHADNSYWRVFDLSNDFNITDDWNVTSVDCGIETAAGASGEQPATIRLHSLSGAFQLANLTLLYEQDYTIYDGMSGNVINFPFDSPVTVPAGTVLVYEFFTPDGQTAGHSFFIGSNGDGQTDDSYISAADCGLNEPSTTGSIGFGNMHIVMNIWGDAGAVVTNTITFTITDNDGSTAIEGASIDINGETLTSDASGVATIDLEDGTYDYTVSAQNYVDVTGQVIVAGAAQDVSVGMDDNGIVTVNSTEANVFPNPSNGIFNIETDGIYEVSVLNVAGEIVWQGAINSNAAIDLSDQAAGVYFLQLKSEASISIQRIMIK